MKARLEAMEACREAVEWVGGRALEQAWAECQRGDWMLWLAAKVDVDRKLLVLAACDCAELALIHVKNDIPRQTLAVVRAWIRGEATLADVDVAAWAAGAAGAARAAAGAAGAAAGAAARAVSLANSAEIVRRNIPYDVINQYWEDKP